MLHRCIPVESYVLQYDLIELDNHLMFVKETITILVRDIRHLHPKAILVVMVQWRHRPIEKATWEIEQDTQKQIPQPIRALRYVFILIFADEFFLIIDVVMILRVIFVLPHYFRYLVLFHSDPKSFVTYCHWQFNYLVVCLNFIQFFILSGFFNLKIWLWLKKCQ